MGGFFSRMLLPPFKQIDAKPIDDIVENLEQNYWDTHFETVISEAKFLDMPVRTLQIHHLRKFLEGIILKVTSHIDHHNGCHEEENVTKLVHVFEYYSMLLGKYR